MLLAELRRKVPRPFACSACGEDVTPEAVIGIEDGLTSHVFGTLRYLPTRMGLGPLLAAAGISVQLNDELDVNAWPFGPVLAIGVGAEGVSSVGVEPDVELCGDHVIICVEVKLGSRLGADPLQLPKEVLWTIGRAGRRSWALLCITADHAPPRIRSFVVEGRTIGLGQPVSINDAVASYFEAARSIAPERAWPEPEQVRSRIAWLSWGQVARVLALCSSRTVDEAWSRRAYEDLIALLTAKGLVAPTFHGFRCGSLLASSGLATIWRSPPAPALLWGRMKCERLSRQRWLARQDLSTPAQDLWRSNQTVSFESVRPIWRRPKPP